MKVVSTLVGGVFLAAGAAKLVRIPAYEAMVAGLDWSEAERRRIGAAELVGAALMLLPATRRLGAGVVLAGSGAALAVELRAGETKLAGQRLGLILATLLVASAG